MKNLFRRFWNEHCHNNPALPWVALFLFLSLFVTQYGGTNARARIAALRAATESGTLHIDRYKDWTIDWSLSPNGHYYSNKPPANFFIGLPVFALMDIPVLILKADQKDKYGRIPEPSYAQHLILILTTQLLPFSVLILVVSGFLARQEVPLTGVHFFALSALFGNTASIYMNCYFGHGMSAMLFLASFYCWHRRRWFWSALFLSWCMLNDYGTIFVLPAFALATLWRERSLKPFPSAVMGALPAAVLWVWYHAAAFGSPFALASHFTNPQQIYQIPGRENLWGTFSWLPYPEFFWRLLFGPERGLLPTQPWILIAIPFLAFLRRDRDIAGGALLLVGGLIGLLWMNAGFGGWHGGWALGPRYPSLIFPAFGLIAALAWTRLPEIARYFLWSGLTLSLLFRWIVLPFPNIAPLEPLWLFHWRLIRDAKNFTPYVRLAISGIAIAGATAWALRGVDVRKAIGLSPKSV